LLRPNRTAATDKPVADVRCARQGTNEQRQNPVWTERL